MVTRSASSDQSTTPDQVALLALSGDRMPCTVAAQIFRTLRKVEAVRTGLFQNLQHRRYGLALRLQARNHPCRTQFVEKLERAFLPGETPAHGAVDIDHIVGYLRHQICGVTQRAAHQVPDEPALHRILEHQ